MFKDGADFFWAKNEREWLEIERNFFLKLLGIDWSVQKRLVIHLQMKVGRGKYNKKWHVNSEATDATSESNLRS